MVENGIEEGSVRKLVAAAMTAAALCVAGSPAGAAVDQGNCISDRDNGGAAGTRISSVAGPALGPAVADALGGGAIGTTASNPDCHRQ
jgi:hypothetical protein